MINHLLPPPLPECAALVWHGGGLEQRHVHYGAIIWRSPYTVGSHVCQYDPLFTIHADDIHDDLCAPVSGYLRWILTPAVARVAPGRTLCLIEPIRPVKAPSRKPQTVSATRPTPPPPLAEAKPRTELVLPPLTGEMVNLKWLHDTGLRDMRDAMNRRYNTSNGELLLAMMMVWSASSEDVRKKAIQLAKGA